MAEATLGELLEDAERRLAETATEARRAYRLWQEWDQQQTRVADEVRALKARAVADARMSAVMDAAEARVQPGDLVTVFAPDLGDRRRAATITEARGVVHQEAGAGGWWKCESPDLADPVPGQRAVVWGYMRPGVQDAATGWQVHWWRPDG